MRARLLSAGGLILAIVALIAVNVLGNETLKGARLDFTAQGLYTLTPGTRRILAALDEPVSLRLYLSQRLATSLPGIKSYTTRVRELLREYELHAHGALRVELIDPEPFSEAEDRAVGYGIRGIPLGDGESTFYFGLVASGPTGEEAVLPFLSQGRERFLEYDLTKLIYQVSQSKKAIVGLLSTLPVEGASPQLALGGAPGQPWTIIDQIRQLFEIRTLDPALTRIDKNIDVLMLVHPKGLGAPTRYAIDQFILRGGKALVFVDPLAEADAGAAQTGAPRYSNPDKLLAAWGVASRYRACGRGPSARGARANAAQRATQGGRLPGLDNPAIGRVRCRGYRYRRSRFAHAGKRR